MSQENVFNDMPVLQRMDQDEMEIWEPEDDVFRNK